MYQRSQLPANDVNFRIFFFGNVTIDDDDERNNERINFGNDHVVVYAKEERRDENFQEISILMLHTWLLSPVFFSAFTEAAVISLCTYSFLTE